MSRLINGTDAINPTDIPTYRQLLAVVSGVSSSGVASTRQLIAGSGIAGGGDLSQDRTFDIGTVDGTIIVAADTIRVGLITTANITTNAVDNTIIRDSIGTSVIGRSVNSTGDPADIQATASGQFLRRDSSATLGFGPITTEDLPRSVTSTSGINIIAGSGLAGGGNLTADRTINIGTSDATIVVAADTIRVGVITTANMTVNSVDNTIIRDSIATSIIGRSANSTGDPADIQATASGQFLRRDSTSLGFGTIGLTDLPGSVTSVSGVVLTAGAGLTGGGALTTNRTFDVVAADATMTINPDSIQVGVIQNANIRTSAATSVIGRSANSIGTVADITALASGHFLRRDGSGLLGFGTIVLSDLPAGITGGGGGGGGDVFSTRQVIAGAGLTGGGNLTADRTFDVVAADTTITVAADNIKVGIITNTNITDDTIAPGKLHAARGPIILGRDSSGAGAIRELDVVEPLHLESGDQELTIRGTPFSVVGQPVNINGPASNISATVSGQFLNMNGSSLAFRNIVKSDLPALDYSPILATYQFAVKSTNTGIPEDLSGAPLWLAPAVADSENGNGDDFEIMIYPFSFSNIPARNWTMQIQIPPDFPQVSSSDNSAIVIWTFELYKDRVATGLIAQVPSTPGSGSVLYGGGGNYTWEAGKGLSLKMSAATFSGTPLTFGIRANIIVQLRI